MHWCHREPTLKDMLSDSIIKAVMDADGVDPHELEAMLRQMPEHWAVSHHGELAAPLMLKQEC